MTCIAEGCSSKNKLRKTTLGLLCDEHQQFYKGDVKLATKKIRRDGVVFDNCEDYLNIFIEILVNEAVEVNYPQKELKKFVIRRINEIRMPV